MFKKILCLVLALISVAGLAVIGVSAAEEEVAAVAADTKIYFEVPSDWNNPEPICCYIWNYETGEKFSNWQQKKSQCTKEADGRYSIDIDKKLGKSLEPGQFYGVIFSSKATGIQTYDLLLSSACYGDTAYCDGTKFENPADSNKTGIATYWKGQNKSTYGPIMGITSVGNVVGTCIAPGETAAGMFTKFLTETLPNARTYSGKSDQEIIDDIAKDLGLGQDSVEKLIKDSGVEVEWKKAESKAPVKDEGIAIKKPGGGSGSSSNPSNPNATSTGQEMTIVYIAVAMMLASAAVVFFARRKRVTE